MILPLDPLTIAWLRARVTVWLANAGLVSLFVLLGAVSGCVPATRFEEAQSAAQVEMDGRRLAEQEIVALKAEKQALQGRLAEQGRALGDREQALAQAQLDTQTVGKQRLDAEGLVEQLRGELARVGDNIRGFVDDKQKLEASLAAASAERDQQREAEAARGRAMSRIARDAALVLADPLSSGELSP